jgi:hypothetical protein
MKEDFVVSLFKRIGIFVVILSISLILISIISICNVERVCQFQYKGNTLGEFDCGVVYNQFHKSACSEDVLRFLAVKFNVSTSGLECSYNCCVTDGTCHGFPPRGINIQMLRLE